MSETLCTETPCTGPARPPGRTGPAGPPGPIRRRWTLALASAGAFMAALDVVVVSTALPTLRSHLGASLSELEWTINAYSLVFGCLMLTGAALGDRFGRRRMYVTGLLVFVLGSALAALSPDAGLLIVARVVQGAARRAAGAAHPDPDQRRLPGRAARHRHRHLGRRHRPGRGGRPGGRRCDRAGRVVAVDLLAERPGRAGRRGAGRAAAHREPRPAAAAGHRGPAAGRGRLSR